MSRTKRVAEVIYTAGSAVGELLVASNVGLAALGYAVFFISSLAGLHLLRISNASKTLYWVTIMFMCINVLGFVRAL